MTEPSNNTQPTEKKTPWAGIITALLGGGLGLVSGGVGGVLFGLIGGVLGGFAVESLVEKYGPQITPPGADPARTGKPDAAGKPDPAKTPPGRSTLLSDVSSYVVKGNMENPFPEGDAGSAVIPDSSTNSTLLLAGALAALQRRYGQPLINGALTPVNWAREAIAGRPLPKIAVAFGFVPGRWHTTQSTLDYARRAAGNYETNKPVNGPTKGEVRDVIRALKNRETIGSLSVQERATMQRMINEYSAKNPSIFRRLWASESSGLLLPAAGETEKPATTPPERTGTSGGDPATDPTRSLPANFEEGPLIKIEKDGTMKLLDPGSTEAGTRLRFVTSDGLVSTVILDPQANLNQLVRDMPEIKPALKEALMREAAPAINEAVKNLPPAEQPAARKALLDKVIGSINANLESVDPSKQTNPAEMKALVEETIKTNTPEAAKPDGKKKDGSNVPPVEKADARPPVDEGELHRINRDGSIDRAKGNEPGIRVRMTDTDGKKYTYIVDPDADLVKFTRKDPQITEATKQALLRQAESIIDSAVKKAPEGSQGVLKKAMMEEAKAKINATFDDTSAPKNVTATDLDAEVKKIIDRKAPSLAEKAPSPIEGKGIRIDRNGEQKPATGNEPGARVRVTDKGNVYTYILDPELNLAKFTLGDPAMAKALREALIRQSTANIDSALERVPAKDRADVRKAMLEDAAKIINETLDNPETLKKTTAGELSEKLNQAIESKAPPLRTAAAPEPDPGKLMYVDEKGRSSNATGNEPGMRVRVIDRGSVYTYIINPGTDISQIARTTPELKAGLAEALLKNATNAIDTAVESMPPEKRADAKKAMLEEVKKSIAEAVETPSPTKKTTAADFNTELTKIIETKAAATLEPPKATGPVHDSSGKPPQLNPANSTIDFHDGKGPVPVEKIPGTHGVGDNTYRSPDGRYFELDKPGTAAGTLTETTSNLKTQQLEAMRNTGVGPELIDHVIKTFNDSTQDAKVKALQEKLTPAQMAELVKSYDNALKAHEADPAKNPKPGVEFLTENAKRIAAAPATGTGEPDPGKKAAPADEGTTGKKPLATLDELTRLGIEANENKAPGAETTKPSAPATALDKLAVIGADESSPAKLPGRKETLKAMDHFDAIDNTARRKSSSKKGNLGTVAMPEPVKGTTAETILNKYKVAATELQTARETLANKRGWAETGDAKAAKQQALKEQMKAKQAEMRTLREQFAAENKSNVEHINGLRASRRLDGLSMVQGSLMLADTYMNTNENTPGRGTRLFLGYGQLGQSTTAGLLNSAALMKPESEALKRAATGFGVAGNTFGVGLNSFMLHEQWKSGTITKAFSGSSSEIKTWDARAQVGSSSSLLVGDVASIGARFAAPSTLGGVAYGANVVGLVLLDAKLIYDDVEKYNEFIRETEKVSKGIQDDASISAGIAGVRSNYIDIPGIPPQMNEYTKLYASLKGLRPKDNYDPAYLDRVAMSEADPRIQLRKYKECLEECVKTGNASSASMTDRARSVSWVCDSVLGKAGLLGDPEKVMKEFEVGADAIYSGKTAEVAMAEFDGAMPNGTRNYIARFDDYEKLIKPLEKDYQPQIVEFFKIPAILRTINPETKFQGLMQLGIELNSAEGKDFEATVSRGQALDDAKMAVVNKAIETKSPEAIKTALGLNDEIWNYKYGTGKSMKEKVDELLKANNTAGVTSIAQEFIKNSGEAKRAAQGWLAKQQFKKEMEHVEKLIADDIKEKRVVGKGKADEYFRKNAAFIKAGGDKWKNVDFSLVGLSTSYEAYKVKKLELAPASMLEGIRANTKKFTDDLVKAKRDNEDLLKTTGPELEAQIKELGGAFEEVEITDEFGEVVMRDDGKGNLTPLTISGRIKEFNNTIKVKENTIAQIQKQIADGKLTYESKEELEAKIEFLRQINAELALAREVTIQSSAMSRLQQADEAKKDYRDETLEIFKSIKDINPKILEELDKEDRLRIEKMTADVQAKSEALMKLPKGVSVAVALQTETAFLKAHRGLAEKLKTLAEKSKEKRTGLAPKVGMPDLGNTKLTGLITSENPVAANGTDLDSLVAMLQNEGIPTAPAGQIPDAFTPDLPSVVQKKQEKGQLT